jgi:hypothetical protein
MESLMIDPFRKPRSLTLKRSVGRGAPNDPDDVIRVHKALLFIDPVWGGQDAEFWEISDKNSPRLVKAIERFQRWNLGTKLTTGCIDPDMATHKQINQILGGAVSIIVVASGGDSALKICRDMTEGEIVASNVQQMIKDIKDRMATDSDKKLYSLVLVSHGGPGWLRLGPRKTWPTSAIALKNINAANPDPKERYTLEGTLELDLGGLRPFFHPKGVVTLGGCRPAIEWDYEVNQETGKAQTPRKIDGKDFLKGLARVLGVPVQGGDQKQRASLQGMEGNCIRCDSGTCYIATGFQEDWWGASVDSLELKKQ